MLSQSQKLSRADWKRRNPDKCRAYHRRSYLKGRPVSESHRGPVRFDSTQVRVHTKKTLRQDVIEKLGGRCSVETCGFSDVRALQIDHVNGGGTQHSRTVSWSIRYRRILAGDEGFQLLCANCNWIKRAENKEATGRPVTRL